MLPISIKVWTGSLVPIYHSLVYLKNGRIVNTPDSDPSAFYSVWYGSKNSDKLFFPVTPVHVWK